VISVPGVGLGSAQPGGGVPFVLEEVHGPGMGLLGPPRIILPEQTIWPKGESGGIFIFGLNDGLRSSVTLSGRLKLFGVISTNRSVPRGPRGVLLHDVAAGLKQNVESHNQPTPPGIGMVMGVAGL